jgi:hypothetical protein
VTRAQSSIPADQVFGTVLPRVDTAVRRMLWSDGPDQGSVDPQLVGSSSCARALTRSVPLTPAAAATLAQARPPLELWPLTIRGYLTPGAGSVAQRFLTEEAHDGRVA